MSAPKYVLVALTEAERDKLLASMTNPVGGLASIVEKLSAPPALSLPTEIIQDLIITRLVKDLLAAGYSIEVVNRTNGEINLPPSPDFAAIKSAIFDPEVDGDDYMLHVYTKIIPGGWVRLIDGNSSTVISDFTTNLEELLEPVNALAEQLEEFEV